jgi:hypothetical protein
MVNGHVIEAMGFKADPRKISLKLTEEAYRV